MVYNCFDTETTALDPVEGELLTGYFAIFDDKFNFLEDLDIVTGPSRNLEDYKITAKAMEINKINLQDHVARLDFLNYEECRKFLFDWFEKMKAKYHPGRGAVFIAVGQNVPFDIEWLGAKLKISKDEWEYYFNRRNRDTSTNATFLKDAGIIPEHIAGLGGLCEYFGLKMGEAHVAKEDVHMTMRLHRKMLELVRGRKNEMSGIPLDILKIIEG